MGEGLEAQEKKEGLTKKGVGQLVARKRNPQISQITQKNLEPQMNTDRK